MRGLLFYSKKKKEKKKRSSEISNELDNRL